MTDKIERVGELHTSKDGDVYKIIEYTYYTTIVVEFLETGNQYKTSYKKVRDKTVRDVDKYYVPTVNHTFSPDLSFEENIELLYEMFKGRTANEACSCSNDFRNSLLTHYKDDKHLFYKFVDLAYDLRTENKYSFIFKSLASRVKPSANYVYLLMKNNVIVYVGKSTKITARLSDHRQEGQKDFDCVLIKEVESTYDMDVLENSLIFKIKPLYNKAIRLDYVSEEVSLDGFINLKEYTPAVIYEKTTISEFRFDIENYLDYDGHFIRKGMVNPVTAEKLGWRKPNYIKPVKHRQDIHWEVIGHRD